VINKQVKNFLVLFFGSILTQILFLAIMPFISEYYSVESFAYLALFTASAASLIPILTGRLGFVLISEQSDRKSNEIFHLAIPYLLFTSSILILIMWGINFISQIEISLVYFFLFVFFSGLFQIIISNTNRNQNYVQLASFKLIKALVIIIGYFSLTSLFDGLVLSHILSLVFIALIYFVFFVKLSWKKVRSFSFNRIFFYRDFVVNNAIATSVNNIVTNLPIFFISIVYGSIVLGSYQLYNLILVVPLSMISQTISQINMGNLVDLRKSKKKILPYFLRITSLIIGMGLTIFLSVMFFNHFLFEVFFDTAKWYLTSDIIFYAVFFNVIEFISSSLSTTIESLRRINRSTHWKIAFTLSSVILHSIAYLLSLSFINYIILLTIERSFIYSYYYYQIIMSVHEYDQSI
tara:strand:- start:82 stop:1302 length:1221 start_codon:yes stop_codon:yes gene_type:complete